MKRGSRLPPPLYGKGISLGKAAKKYDVPVSTLSDWAERGELTIIKKPELKGQAMLVDEASVVMAAIRRKRGYRIGGVEQVQLAYPPPGVVPAVELPQHSTAELVEQYHLYGESVGFKTPTMENYRQILKLFIRTNPKLPLTPEPILTFIHDLEVGMARKKTYYQVIRAFYNYLVDFHNIPTPLKPRMVPRVEKHIVKVLSREEVTRLFNAAANFQEKMMLEIFYATRIRESELVSMTSENTFPDHIIVTGKTGPWEVPIQRELYDQLMLLCGNGPLFLNNQKKPITRDGVYHRIQACMKRAGITGKKLGPHTLRHTSLTHLYEDTGDIPLVQEAARHADIRMTMEYTHPRAAKQREKLLQHDPLKRLNLTRGEGNESAQSE